MKRLLLPALLLSCSSSETKPPEPKPTTQCTFEGAAEPDLPEPRPHTPRWAFRPWISKDISTRDDTYAFVKGFEDRDIPVGVVVLDSPWETNYNTFVPNPSRYPEFPKMVNDLHAKGIRLVLWITQFVNHTSFDFEPGGDRYPGAAPKYDEGSSCGFFVNDGTDFGWWKGSGGSVDFFNARARAWWHAQQKPLLDMGIDGWKLDFGDSYVDTPIVKTAKGEVPHQEYSEAYYRDFLAYGASVRGSENFVTMVRPWDESYQFKGRFFARREHAPVAWVGDNRRDWIGFIDALDHIFRSAQAGYPMLGSDIGGYLDLDDKTLQKVPPDTLVFARWTSASALMPFFQLHGRANLTPWTVTDHVDETVALYRYWSKLHDALVPFFYSLTEAAWKKPKTSILFPIGEGPEQWKNDFRFAVGEAFLVAPLLDASSKRDVLLPAGAKYYDWFRPEADAIEGGTKVAYEATDRLKMPLFVREGAIVPLDVVDDANGLGTVASKGARTVLVWPRATASSFDLLEEDEKSTRLEAGPNTFSASRVTRTLLVRMRADAAKGVRAGPKAGPSASVPRVDDRAAFDASTTAWWLDTKTRSLWIKLPKSENDVTITVEP